MYTIIFFLISYTFTGLSPKVFLCLVSEVLPSHHKFIIEKKKNSKYSVFFFLTILLSVYYDKDKKKNYNDISSAMLKSCNGNTYSEHAVFVS